MRVLTSTDEHPGHATEAAIEAEEEAKQQLVCLGLFFCFITFIFLFYSSFQIV